MPNPSELERMRQEAEVDQDMRDEGDLLAASSGLYSIAASNITSTSFVLGIAGKTLLTIHKDGTVEAPDLESASEAGKVFVDSIRHQLEEMIRGR